MKKTLSLKKKATSNKQQKITTFLGNASFQTKLPTQEVISEGQIKSNKRKAYSPLKVELDLFTEQTEVKHGSENNVFKKCRMDRPNNNGFGGSNRNNEASKTLPIKEGHSNLNMKLSLKKQSITHKELDKTILVSDAPKNISKFNKNADTKVVTHIHTENNDNILPSPIKNSSKDSMSKLSLAKKTPDKYQKEQSKSPLSPSNKNKLKSSTNFDFNDIREGTSSNVMISPNKTNNCKRKLSLNKKNKHHSISTNYEIQSVNQKENICNESIEICINSSKKDVNKTLHTSPCASSYCKSAPEKECDNQPSQNGATVDEFNIDCLEMDDIFEDIDIDYIEDTVEDLDLTMMQRCKIIEIIKHTNKLEIKLKNNMKNRGTCFIEGNWLNTLLQSGDIISILASRDSTGCFIVNNTEGLIVLRPDHLISSTSVVSGVFCRRKAVLQERWKGIDSANTAMTMGILFHELVQKALTQNISSVPHLKVTTHNIIKDSIERLYDAGISEEQAKTNMQVYIEPLAEFMQTYVVNNKSPNPKKCQWNGKVEKVLDIEENLCCPKMGLKGKIDATLQVTIHNKKGRSSATVPLELKSGRASMSAEHRGQLVMYGMMMSVLDGKDPARGEQSGLLLYLKDKINMTTVSCDYPERRDLVILRNELVQHLAPGPNDVSPDDIRDIEDLSMYHQSLPDPVNHHSACSKCAYLSVCSLHLWHTDGPKVSDGHPLVKLKTAALGHLSADHIQYFLQWASLIRIEESIQLTMYPIHTLWTDSTEIRTKRGSCVANLTLKRVTSSSDRYLHVFVRNGTKSDQVGDNKFIKGPQEGDFSIVGVEHRPWVAAGVVTLISATELQILLERDLSRRMSKSTKYHIDTYKSYGTSVYNLTNLGLLMEDTHQASTLRKLIIDRKPPEFVQKLPPQIQELGEELLSTLNTEQQDAIKRILKSNDYVLLQGLPGTGKTQTLCVLVQLLCLLNMRVLVTAHTHSAVDTLLNRLPSSLNVLRVGTSSRVSVNSSVKECTTVKQLTDLYNSVRVVGVTCLGASHPLLSKTTFDFCIVDEATQVLQCTVLRPLFAARQFVLVGDPEQLPPIVRSRDAKRLGMEVSLFHRLMRDESTCILSLQYRMNQPLADLANKIAYSNRLKCANETVAKAALNVNIQKLSKNTLSKQWLVTACSPKPEDAAIFLDTKLKLSETGGQRTLNNKDEAVVMSAVIDALKEAGVSESDIGVIAPYRDQVSMLCRVLVNTQVEVSTVDQFQGRDKSVIIYSCTRNYDDDRIVKEDEVLNDQRRLAVSVTRAKHKLIAIGNMRALERYTSIKKLAAACKTVDLDEGAITQLHTKYQL